MYCTACWKWVIAVASSSTEASKPPCGSSGKQSISSPVVRVRPRISAEVAWPRGPCLGTTRTMWSVLTSTLASRLMSVMRMSVMRSLLRGAGEALADGSGGFLVGGPRCGREHVVVDLVAGVESGVEGDGDDRADPVLEALCDRSGIATTGGGVMEQHDCVLHELGVSEAGEVVEHDFGGVGAVGAGGDGDDELVRGLEG